MKAFAVLALVASVLFLSLGSCVSSRARLGAQFPAASLAWPGVQGDYLRGLDDGVGDGELDVAEAANLRNLGAQLGAALDQKSTDELRLVPWSRIMRPWADRGIQDKLDDVEIGPTVAEALRDRVVNFTATIESLQRIYR